MTSYFSSLLTTTTSRVASIRQNLLPSENDGDLEDDTHLCRVLRAYYNEKGRAFPPWLPLDPKAPPPSVVQPVYAHSQIGARHGGIQSQGASSGALSSLWDSRPTNQQPAAPQSLRQGRATPGGSPAPRQNPYARQQSTPEPQIQARPLPSQRAGRSQTASTSAWGRGNAGDTPPSSSSGGTSAHDRLKKKLGQGRASLTPSMGSSTSQGYQDQQHGSSHGRGDRYEDLAIPSGAAGGYNGGSERPFVAATAPWASNEYEFDGGSKWDAGRSGGPRGPRY